MKLLFALTSSRCPFGRATGRQTSKKYLALGNCGLTGSESSRAETARRELLLPGASTLRGRRQTGQPSPTKDGLGTRDCGSRTGKRSPHLQTSSSPRLPRHRSPNLHPAERHFPGRSPPQRAAAAAAPERLITSIPRGRRQLSQCSASAVTRVTAWRLDSRPAA